MRREIDNSAPMIGIKCPRLTSSHVAQSHYRPMIDIPAVFASTVVLMLLAGCGPSAPPPIDAKPNVIVTLDGKSHACVVALYSEANGSSISCTDVVPFVRDELRLAKGAIYDIRTI